MNLESIITKSKTNNSIVIWRITALWGFSESALGGILHVFKIPVTGLIAGSAAVIFITLIAYFSHETSDTFSRKGIILKATFTVLIIKGFVSPYTPVTAYFAVLLQGFMGEILFSSSKHFKLSTISLGILTLVTSALQKIIILTIVFGNSLWESIDEFSKFVFSQFGMSFYSHSLYLSYTIICLYLFIHLIAGIYIGFFAARLPGRIINLSLNESEKIQSLFVINNNRFSIPRYSETKKSKVWWKKKSGVLIFIFSLMMIALSYFHPEVDENISLNIFIMLIRSAFIIFVWFKFLSPFLLKVFKKLLSKKTSVSSFQVEDMINFFPQFRTIISNSWNQSSNIKGTKKINNFLTYTIAAILFFQPEEA